MLTGRCLSLLRGEVRDSLSVSELTFYTVRKATFFSGSYKYFFFLQTTISCFVLYLYFTFSFEKALVVWCFGCFWLNLYLQRKSLFKMIFCDINQLYTYMHLDAFKILC